MVTGAGGSIGSELCAPDRPRRGRGGSMLVDHAEENMFRIQRELEDDRHVPPASAAVLADCKEGERMREVFAEHEPTSCSTPPPTSTSG